MYNQTSGIDDFLDLIELKLDSRNYDSDTIATILEADLPVTRLSPMELLSNVRGALADREISAKLIRTPDATPVLLTGSGVAIVCTYRNQGSRRAVKLDKWLSAQRGIEGVVLFMDPMDSFTGFLNNERNGTLFSAVSC
jgi:hypothetical protein